MAPACPAASRSGHFTATRTRLALRVHWKDAMRPLRFACLLVILISEMVLAQSNAASFAPVVTYGSGGGYAGLVAMADVNGDGKPDLLVANECAISTNCAPGSVGVLLGNGDGTFRPAVTYGTGGYDAESVAVADVNGDGKPDLIAANGCQFSNCQGNGLVGVLLGNGDGTFQPAVTYGAGGYNPSSVVVADVNGDGKPDLLVTNYCAPDNCDSGNVGVLLGNSDGTFQAAVTYGSGGVFTWPVAVADVNGGGRPDLGVANAWTSSTDLFWTRENTGFRQSDLGC
jgi:hypothetical protein